MVHFSPVFVTHFLQHVPIVHGTGESPSAPFRIAASAALWAAPPHAPPAPPPVPVRKKWVRNGINIESTCGKIWVIYIYIITICNSHYLKCFIVTNRVINWSRISMDFFQPQKSVSFYGSVWVRSSHTWSEIWMGQITSQWSVLLCRRRSKWSFRVSHEHGDF